MIWNLVPTGRAARLVTLAMAVALTAVALFLVPARAEVSSVSGGLLVEVPREDSVLLELSDMVPGEITQGAMRLTNTGVRPIRVALRTTELSDVPGANGGVLSDIIRLRLTDADGSTEFYDGPIRSLPQEISLGRLAVMGKTTVVATANFPDSGLPATLTTGDNAYMRSALRSVFTVVKEDLADDTMPPVAILRQTSASADSASRGCISRRTLTVRLVTPRTFKPRRVRLLVAGKPVKTKWVGKGGKRRLTGKIDLAGRRQGRFPVRVVVTRADGKSWRYTRYFRTCAPERPSAAKPPKFTPQGTRSTSAARR